MEKFMRLSAGILLSTSLLLANINGSDTQLFKPTPDGLDFIGVHSTRTLLPFHFNTGLFVNTSFNSLAISEDKRTYTTEDILFSTDINLGYGIMKNLSAGFNAPAAVYHHTTDEFSGLYFEETGFLELAFNIKYTPFPRTDARKWGLSIIPSLNYPVVQDTYFIGVDKNPIFNLELATDFKLGSFIFGLNAGYRYRTPGTDPTGGRLQLIDDQLLASLAITYFSEPSSTGFTFEVYGATEAGNAFDTDTTPIEALLALKYNPLYNLSLIAGTAAGLSVSIGNPDYRFFGGLNYYFGFAGKDHRESTEFEADLKRISEFTPEKKELRIEMSENLVFFEWDRYILTGRSKSVLAKVAYSIKTNSNISSIIIIGHTDSTGTNAYNLSLSGKRAKAVSECLIENGVANPILRTTGKGESEPVADNSTYNGRARNRRVEIVFK